MLMALVQCSTMQGSIGFCGCGLVSMSILCSRTLLEEDYRDVLESRLRASLPASTAGSVSHQ